MSNITLNVHLYLDDVKEQTAYENLKKLKDFGLHITATSPKTLSPRMMEVVDVLLHDKENLLLTKDYGLPKPMYYWHDNGSFRLDFGRREQQPHSLAVLRSMIKGCELALMKGFDWVIRIEFDDILSKNSVDWLIEQSKTIDESMLFFKNDHGYTQDISMHTILYKPQEFLNIFGDIKSEEDYHRHIINLGIDKHLILEEFIFIMLDNKKPNVKYVDGLQMSALLPDSIFNLHSSPSSLIGGCLIDIMRCNNGLNYFSYICYESPGCNIVLKQKLEGGEILENSWDVFPTNWIYLPIDTRTVYLDILVDSLLYTSYEFIDGVLQNECLSTITFR
jgi:hypothetical protein